MNRRQHRARRLRAVIAASVLAGLPSLAGATASISFESGSTCKITHDADISTALEANGIKQVNPPPVSGSMPTPNTYQYGLATINNNAGTSTAEASIGALTTAANIGYTFSSGTGITQNDPGPSGTNFSNYSQLQFLVSGTWNINSAISSAYGGISFTLGGVIPSGDHAQIEADLTWTNQDGTVLFSTSDLVTLNHTSPTVPYNFVDTGILGTGSLPSGSRVNINGSIYLRARDPGTSGLGGPAGGDFFFDVNGASGPTYQFTGNGGDTSVSDAANWDNLMKGANPGLGAVPNFADARMLFSGDGFDAPVIVDTDTTLGMIDIDEPNVGLESAANGVLNFATGAGNDAVIHVRNTHEFSKFDEGHQIAVPITLQTDLQVINDAPGSLQFGGSITGAHGLIKDGLGEVSLNNANAYSGGTTINAGVLDAAVDGALGSGTVTLSGGMLDIKTPNPFLAAMGTGTIHVQQNGQTMVDVQTGNVLFDVGDLACITTNDPANNLDASNSGNLTLHAGAMIGHETFDPALSGVPAGLAPADLVNYTYGLSSDGNGVVTVGDGAPGLWGGFGGDKFKRTFDGQLNIVGQAHIDSLGSELVMNASIAGAGNDPLTKRGQGLVALESNNNSYTGPLVIDSGPLAVDGNWAGDISVGVGAQSASLGGTGTIHSGVAGPLARVSASPFASVGSTVTIGPNGELHPGPYGAVGTFADNPTTIEGPGTLTVDNLVLEPGSKTYVDIAAPGPAGSPGNDLVIVNGDLTLGGTLELIEGTGFDPNGTYILMHYTGSVSGTLTLDPSFNGPVDDNPMDNVNMVVYVDPVNQNVLLGPLGVAPEPGTLGLIAFGMLPMIRRRRRHA